MLIKLEYIKLILLTLLSLAVILIKASHCNKLLILNSGKDHLSLRVNDDL